jgi:hypothetical protein
MKLTVVTVACISLVLMGASSAATAFAQGSQTLTFEDYGEGTPITNQYEPDGIIFSGSSPSEPPFIAWDTVSSTNPVLSGDPRFHGPIHGEFVAPGTTLPTTVDGLSMEVGFIDDPESVTLTIFTTTGTETIVANEEGFDYLESSASNITGFVVEETSFEAEGFEIDNVSFTPGAPPVITPAQSTPPPIPSTPPPAQSTPPPSPPANPCTPSHGSIAHEMLASIKCTTHETELELECGVGVAGLIFLPLKSLKLVEAAKGLDVIDKLPASTRPTAKFLYDLYHAKFSKSAPAGFRSGAEAVSTIGKLKKAYQLVELLPDIAKAVSKADFSQIALDLDDIVGLKSCVQAVADGLAG